MKLAHLLIFVAASIALLGHVRAQAVIEGRVELPEGRRAPVMVKRYDIVTRSGAIAPNPAVAVVYLEGKFGQSGPLPVKQMNQKDYDFSPGLLPVQLGTKVEFPNLDKGYHNVFSYSGAKRFDLGRYRPDERPIPFQVFDKPGMVTLRCEIHEHMRALILVLDTPHFVTTGTDGRFKLGGLPAGTFKLKAWLSSKSTLERPVVLKNGSTLQVNFP